MILFLGFALASKELIEVVIKGTGSNSNALQTTSNSNSNTLHHQTTNHPSIIPHKDHRCFILNTLFGPIPEIESLLSTHKDIIKSVYTKNILGFEFCSSREVVSRILDKITGKYSMINLEEDKPFKVSSVGSGNTYYNSLDITMFRVSNIGNLTFNNYILDYPLLRSIRFLYGYDRTSGKNTRITVIDTPPCHPHRHATELILADIRYSLSRNAEIRFIEGVGCDGTIKLSRILEILENVPQTDVLLIPFYGPYSEVLNLALKRISTRMTVVASAGDDGTDACNFSPNGRHIIKVGSATKHGYVDDTSNRGSCVNLYALGENPMNDSVTGSGYAAAFVASSISQYRERYRDQSLHQVLRFLAKNSAKNEYDQLIMKIPVHISEARMKFYPFWQVLIFNALIVCLVLLVVIWTVRLIRRIRRLSADREYFSMSLRRRSEDSEEA